MLASVCVRVFMLLLEVIVCVYVCLCLILLVTSKTWTWAGSGPPNWTKNWTWTGPGPDGNKQKQNFDCFFGPAGPAQIHILVQFVGPGPVQVQVLGGIQPHIRTHTHTQPSYRTLTRWVNKVKTEFK